MTDLTAAAAMIVDTGDPADIANVVHRRQAAYDGDPSDENARRLQIAVDQATANRVSVGRVNNDDVDAQAVVDRRQAAYDADPTERNRRRLDIAQHQLAEQE